MTTLAKQIAWEFTWDLPSAEKYARKIARQYEASGNPVEAFNYNNAADSLALEQAELERRNKPTN